ncbi:AMP-binding protein [Prosthecomicrobium hirschii]|uniref:AMP-binding protein n=1 Tax=Prosthecodimorpha hirschii TaxID=665126 RepID=A0A0P6W495_9HYPH|nr:class I adenylate-forming enzyme family protein [Prosthecomicrobium hirschii]KPL53261.1 AMP-binding protein [Prosthecomicrobium hirschii]
MKREYLPAQPVAPVQERIRLIEAAPLPRNVSSILADAAADAPEALAVHFFEEGVALSYADLKSRVDSLARGLSKLGVRPEARVGVLLPNIAAFPITWLALARIGAVMIPLNIAYTSHEIGYVLNDAGAQWLVTHDEFAEVIAQTPVGKMRPPDACTIVVGAPRDGQKAWSEVLESGEDASLPLPPLDAIGHDHLLNLQYTSGTTGLPKGCLLTHRYWVTVGTVNAYRDGLDYRRILAATPFFYMDPQWLLLMAMLQRATLFVARRQSASRFMQWIREYRINFTLFPEIVFKRPSEPDDPKNEIIRVNVYHLGRDIHAELEKRFDFVAREAYGMTEIGSGMFMPIEAVHMVGSGSCGRPSPFRRARIVSPDGTVLGDDQVGELQISGPGILLGYHNRPEATAAAFDGEWFRTGDMARRDENGFYYIVGRLKDMIRRAGENIAANEVEAVLRQVPEVADAAVVPVPDDTRGEEVKAYVVLRDGYTADVVPPRLLLDSCAQKLARFKVPRYITYRDTLPMTASGKIAKHILLNEDKLKATETFDAVENRWS